MSVRRSEQSNLNWSYGYRCICLSDFRSCLASVFHVNQALGNNQSQLRLQEVKLYVCASFMNTPTSAEPQEDGIQ